MRVEATSSNNYSEMSESTGNHRKRYVDNPKYISRQTCLIHGHDHSLDEYKVLGDFGYKYSKIRPTKNRRNEPATKKVLT